MNFAVTGPRRINNDQSYIIGRQIRQVLDNLTLLITGAAFGVDTYACEFATKLYGVDQLLCVPDDPHNEDLVQRMRANSSVKIIYPGDYRERNQCMVNSSHVLLAFPETPKEILRSGTWMTIRMARKAKIPIYFHPLDGSEGFNEN